MEEEGQGWPRPSERPPLACYANYFEVGHNAYEFLIDACQLEPQTGAVQFMGRLAVSPVHAKLLTQLLSRSIEQFEELHHLIPEIVPGESVVDLAFTSPTEFERRAMDARRKPAPPGSSDPDFNER